MHHQVQKGGGTGASDPILLSNPPAAPFNVGFGVVLNGASLTYKVQHSFSTPAAVLAGTAAWFDHEDVVAQNTDADGNYAFPVTAIRLYVTAHSSGTAILQAIQAGV